MFRALVTLFLVATAVMAAPINLIDQFPAELRDLIPTQVKEFLTGLADEDKKAIYDIFTNLENYKSNEEVLADLKEKSPTLYEKAEKFNDILKEKFAALGAEANAFVFEILGESAAFSDQVMAGNKPSLEDMQYKILKWVEKYNALSADAKADLEKQFPITFSIIKNEKFQEIAKKILNKN